MVKGYKHVNQEARACLNCGEAITSRGKLDKKFCDDGCRAQWHRKRREMAFDLLAKVEGNDAS